MLRLSIFLIGLFLIVPSFATSMTDDPILTMIKVDQLEIIDIGNKNDMAWDLQGWIGQDLNKLWLKTEGESVNSEIEEAEVQLLYSRAVAPYWDAQIGWRHDSQPSPTRDWLVFGIQGLAPYFFETDIAFFISDSGNIGLRTQFEYELMLSQKWILSPELEANIFTKSDAVAGTGEGLSDMSLGLRLRYELKREFAPYIGIEWNKRFGKTADFAREENEHISNFHWVMGVRVWF